MGFFKKLTGGTNTKLLETGLPGRGLILEVRPHGTTVKLMGGMTERVCTFRLQVNLDNRPGYEVTCDQRVAEVYIPTLSQPNAVVAVRANPDRLEEVVLDLEHDAPTVTVARDQREMSAAEILAGGRPAQAVIVAFAPLGMMTPEGVGIQGFRLTVMPTDGAPYQVEVGNATPAEALPLLFPGSKVPVKLGPESHDVVIDWAQALAAA